MLDRTAKAGKPPKTDHWSALENEHDEGTVMLLVSGVVQVRSTNLEPRLTEAASGPNAALILDLTVEAADHPGTDVLVWKQATFSRRVAENEFGEVRIRWAGTPIARCKVLDDDQAHARLKLHTEAANEKVKITNVAGKARKAAQAVVEAVGKAIGGSTARAVGTAVAAAVGTAAVAGAASRLMAPATKKKSKAKAKSASKSTSKSKTKAKGKTKAKAKKTTKKAAAKNKAAPKKSAKGASKKSRNVKKRRGAKKSGTKKSGIKKRST